MSRLGKKPIKLPSGTQVLEKGGTVTVTGPKGSVSKKLNFKVFLEAKDDQLYVRTPSDLEPSYWGLARSLVANLVKGVNESFRKDLEIVGVGYRASKKGNDLSVSVGYSNPVEFKAPEGIKINVEENTKISVEGVDKELVGLVASQIRAIRKPEPYKGKGIKYKDEVIRRKAGKAASKTA